MRAFHELWGYGTIVANGVAGALALAAWRLEVMRGTWLWVVTAVAQVAILVQVVTGVVMLSRDFVVDDIHVFYGFVAFATVGLAYSYRDQMRGRLELLYGCVGLFLMGIGIRALVEVA